MWQPLLQEPLPQQAQDPVAGGLQFPELAEPLVPHGAWVWIPALFALVVGGLLIASFWRDWKQVPRHREPTLDLDARVPGVELFERLQQAGLDPRRFAERLAALVRFCVARRWPSAGRAQTTDVVLATVAEVADGEERAVCTPLAELLRRCDDIKFRGAVCDASVVAELSAAARAVVTALDAPRVGQGNA